MTAPIFAFVIGVSNYRSNDFHALPAARSDALNFYRMLLQRGVPEENILLLDGDYVTQDEFHQCIKKMSSLTTPFRLLFYFCGHGHRAGGESPQSYLAFSDSELCQGLCVRGVQLEKLLHTFCNMKTTAVHVFIDACHLRLNSVINPKLLEEIEGKTHSSKALFCLFSSGILPSYESVEHKYGYFTEALIKALTEHMNPSPEMLYKSIQKELSKLNLPSPEMYNIGMHKLDIFPKQANQTKTDEMKRVMGALYSCGIVIDEALFCTVFEFESESFKALEDLNLIFYEKGSWHPDERLNEIVERESFVLEPARTKLYWHMQFRELPDHFLAAIHFVMCIQCFGFEQVYDDALLAAFKILYQHHMKTFEVLKNSAAIYHHVISSKSGQYLAEIMIELQQFELSKSILNIHSNSNAVTHCHLLWRTGRFSECIQQVTKVIDSLSIPQTKIPYLWHRGTAYYLAGDWNKAQSDFSFVENHSNHALYVARSLCLLGTLTGIRGIHVKASTAKIEKSIKLMMQQEDVNGAWVGWNNLGEIMCKAGDFKLSHLYLKIALEISQEVENDNMILETLRNVLHLELKKPDASESSIEALLDQIELLVSKPIEIFESLQIYNTLCAAYLFLGDLTKAQFYLKRAIPLTVASKEYHIYTLFNLSLLCKKQKQKEKSSAYLQEALALAQMGNNHFAIQQIRALENQLVQEREYA